jgi:type II secretory pathway component PulF
MMKSGLPIDESVPIVMAVVKNAQYKRMLRILSGEIAQGNDVSAVFGRFPSLVPPMAVSMMYVGEQAGTLEAMFFYLAEFYDREVDEITRGLSSLIEPFLLIGVGLLVGGIALAVLMPIYQVVGEF